MGLLKKGEKAPKEEKVKKAKKTKKAKKAKKVMEPQYYTSATGMPTYNYKVYYLKPLEKVICFLIAFCVGAAVGYLFYGGLAKDEFGDPTKITWFLNITISGIAGLICGIAFLPIRRNQVIEKQRKTLNHQFRDMLEGLTTSLNAGKNVADSFHAVYDDLKVQYDEGAYILQELEIVLSGMANNVDIEDLLADFGVRSGIDDISSFANVFKICYRKGGNIKETIRTTHEILSDKMEISEEIETIVTGSKSEQTIMVFMPIALIGVIKLMSPEFAANFTTPSGVASTTVAIGLFVAAYFIGKVVLDIKV